MKVDLIIQEATCAGDDAEAFLAWCDTAPLDTLEREWHGRHIYRLAADGPFWPDGPPTSMGASGVRAYSEGGAHIETMEVFAVSVTRRCMWAFVYSMTEEEQPGVLPPAVVPAVARAALMVWHAVEATRAE